MSIENLDYQQVLFALAKTREKVIQLVFSLSRSNAMKSAKSSFSLRSYQNTEFYYAVAIDIDDSFGNLITWDLVCKFEAEWCVELEIFLNRKEARETENIFSYPSKRTSMAMELILALDWAVAEIETSIASRNISSWIELSKS